MKKIIFASVLGNALEFYDFTLYGVFSVVLAETFFPGGNFTVALLKSLGVFAAGFLMRPFGAAVFGHIGDRWGRKKALMLSIFLMGVPTLMIGIMPTYAEIGWIAPTLVILCRMLQGLCTGGEYNGAAIFALEHAGKNHPGLTGGLITGSAGLGAVLAMSVAMIFDAPNTWRWAFVLGTVASLWGVWLRRKIDESPEFKKIEKKSIGLISVFKDHQLACLITLIFGIFDGVLSYVVFTFLNVYLSVYTLLSSTMAKGITLLSIVSFTVSAPLMGYAYDCLGRGRFLRQACGVIALGILPLFWFIESGSLPVIIAMSLLVGIFAGTLTGNQHAFVQNLFPPETRYRGISISFSCGISIGGLTPFILLALVDWSHSLIIAGIYVFIWSLICLWALRQEKKVCLSFTR